jgi:hypothetical protein
MLFIEWCLDGRVTRDQACSVDKLLKPRRLRRVAVTKTRKRTESSKVSLAQLDEWSVMW